MIFIILSVRSRAEHSFKLNVSSDPQLCAHKSAQLKSNNHAQIQCLRTNELHKLFNVRYNRNYLEQIKESRHDFDYYAFGSN